MTDKEHMASAAGERKYEDGTAEQPGKAGGTIGGSAVYIPDSYLHQAADAAANDPDNRKAINSLIKRYTGGQRGLQNIPHDKRREFLDDLGLLAGLPPMYTIEATLFPDKTAQDMACITMTPADLVARIGEAKATDKKYLPWLKLAVFGNKRTEKNSLRHNANVRWITGAVGDYDGGKIPFDEAVERVRQARLAAVLYTTPSNTADKPRWRIVAPASGCCEVSEHTVFMDRLNGLFDGDLAGESWTLSQSYYFGSVEGKPPAQAEVVEGYPIDWCSGLPGIPKKVCEGPQEHRERSGAEGTPVSIDEFRAAGAAAATACASLHYPDLQPVITATGRVPVEGDDDCQIREEIARLIWNSNTTSQSTNDDAAFERAFTAPVREGGRTANPGTFFYWAMQGGWKPQRSFPQAWLDLAKKIAEEQAANADAGVGKRRVKFTGADVMAELVKWIWPHWLARGKYHLYAGTKGAGKSTTLFDIAATITSGGKFPDGSQAPVGEVVIWSSEDDYRDTILPRFLASGGDQSRLRNVDVVIDEQGRRVPFDPAHDVDALFNAARQLPDLQLIIIDPIVMAVGGDSHKNAETRRGLQGLVDMAAALDAALVGITHFSKGTEGKSLIERVNGSLAFAALARIVWGAVASDDDTVRRFAKISSNISKGGGGFEYTMTQAPVPDYSWTAQTVTWGAVLTGSADDILGKPREQSKLIKACEWLADLLWKAGAVGMPVKEIRAAAEAFCHAWRTVEDAKKKLSTIEAFRNPGATTGYSWRLRSAVKYAEYPGKVAAGAVNDDEDALWKAL